MGEEQLGPSDGESVRPNESIVGLGGDELMVKLWSIQIKQLASYVNQQPILA